MKDALKALAKWDLEKHKDYYPAEAMQDDTCTHNGLIGNCGLECKAYLLDKCPIPDEVNEAALEHVDDIDSWDARKVGDQE